MKYLNKHYIDGAWAAPKQGTTFPIRNPADDSLIGKVTLDTATDVDGAAEAANRAFKTFSQTSKLGRIALLKRLLEDRTARLEEMSSTTTHEMGARAVSLVLKIIWN